MPSTGNADTPGIVNCLQPWFAGCEWLGIPSICHESRRAEWLQEVAAKIRERRAQGVSVREIAERLAVSESTIRRWQKAGSH